MAYYSADEMKKILDQNPQFREKLYCRGFLLTNDGKYDTEGYPFYGNWKVQSVKAGNNEYDIYTHKDANVYIYSDAKHTLFLFGHAYNPFRMKMDEKEILKDLSEALKSGIKSFWEAESELTGVFCVGYITEKGVVYSTDCAGMQLVYHGTADGKLFLTSHSKLAADLKGFHQSRYVQKLIRSRFWHYWGTWLPGDLSCRRICGEFWENKRKTLLSIP